MQPIVAKAIVFGSDGKYAFAVNPDAPGMSASVLSIYKVKMNPLATDMTLTPVYAMGVGIAGSDSRSVMTGLALSPDAQTVYAPFVAPIETTDPSGRSGIGQVWQWAVGPNGDLIPKVAE